MADGVTYSHVSDLWVAEVNAHGSVIRERFKHKNDAVAQYLEWKRSLETGSISYKKYDVTRSRLHDLTGKTFGELTVLHYIKYFSKEKGKWVCRCSCGNEVELPRYSLLNTAHPCCGCKKPRTSKRKRQFKFDNPEDRVGEVYGDFKVVAYDSTADKFDCECIKCGLQRTYSRQSVYMNNSCSHYTGKRQKMNTNIFGIMTMKEASVRCGITIEDIRAMIAVGKVDGLLREWIFDGLIKPPYTDDGVWMISANLMRKWFNCEVKKITKKYKFFID